VAGKSTGQLSEPFGRPGIPPRWTSSSKDGIGTAYSTSSRVWFTISYGILDEIYFPTIDRPQTRDMQFLITDGESSFTKNGVIWTAKLNASRPIRWAIE
jgi:glucoamylase